MSLTRAVERIARSQVNHPWYYLLAAAVLTALAFVAVRGLVFDASYEALLPEDSPEVQNLDDVRARTGGTRQLIVAIRGGEPEDRLAFAAAIAPDLEQVDGVRCVDWEFPVEFFEDRALLFLETSTLDELVAAVDEAIEKTKWFQNPFNPHLQGEEEDRKVVEERWDRVDAIIEENTQDLPVQRHMVSEDGQWLFVSVIPTFKFSDMGRGARFMEDVEAVVSRNDPQGEGLEVRYAGNIEMLREQTETTLDDLRKASVIALVLAVILVTVATRRPIAPLAVGIPLLAGVAWTFAVVNLTIGHVNIITGFLVSILIGLGIDFGIHLFVRYQQEIRHGGAEYGEAMVRAVVGTFRPAFTSALTTSGTFLTFIVATFRGFSEFGLIASIGVLFTLISSFLVLPPLVIVIERLRRRPHSAARLTRTPDPRGDPGLRFTIPCVLVFLGAAILGAVEARHVEYHNDFAKLRGESEATEFLEFVDDNLGNGFNPAVMLVPDVEDTARVASMVRSDLASDPDSMISKVLGASDLLPADADAKMERIDRLRDLVTDRSLNKAEGVRRDQLDRARELVEVQPWGIDDLPDSVHRRFVSLDASEYLVYIWPAMRNDSDAVAVAWEEDLEALESRVADEGIEYSLADETLILAWVHSLVLEESPTLLTVAALVVLLILLLDFRRIGWTLLVATPLVTGVLVFLAYMTLFDREFNLFNIIVLPSAVGIGIDNAVHVFHRHRAEGPGSIRLVVRRTGMAALLASSTTAVGFGSGLIAHQLGIRTLAELAVVAIACTMLSAVVFFPSVLGVLDRIRHRT